MMKTLNKTIKLLIVCFVLIGAAYTTKGQTITELKNKNDFNAILSKFAQNRELEKSKAEVEAKAKAEADAKAKAEVEAKKASEKPAEKEEEKSESKFKTSGKSLLKNVKSKVASNVGISTNNKNSTSTNSRSTSNDDVIYPEEPKKITEYESCIKSGIYNLKTDNISAAFRYFGDALKENPNGVEANMYYGFANLLYIENYWSAMEPEKYYIATIKHLTFAIQNGCDSARAVFFMGKAFNALKETELSKSYLTAYYEINPPVYINDISLKYNKMVNLEPNAPVKLNQSTSIGLTITGTYTDGKTEEVNFYKWQPKYRYNVVGGEINKCEIMPSTDAKEIVNNSIKVTVSYKVEDIPIAKEVTKEISIPLNYGGTTDYCHTTRAEYASSGTSGSNGNYTSSGTAGHGLNGQNGKNGGIGKNAEAHTVYVDVYQDPQLNKELLKVEISYGVTNKKTFRYKVDPNDGEILINAKGGKGGNGGDGGKGGNGGRATGESAYAGNGGNGGDGGYGGNGGNGGKITMFIDPKAAKYLSVIKLSADGGDGGDGGKAGEKGDGGLNSSGSKEGADGQTGSSGNNGQFGLSGPKAEIITKEVNLTW